MNTQDLEIFIAAYQHKNYSKAAADFFITPQGVSKVIHRLEAELGKVLFLRTRQGVRPTQEADLLAVYAAKILEQEKALKARLQNPFYTEQTTLRVVFAAGILSYLTPVFRQAFTALHPDILLNLFEYSDTEVDSVLRSDMAEIGFQSEPIDFSYYDAIPFFTHEVCAVMNKKHPLAQKDTVSYQDFDGEILAFLGPKYYSYNQNRDRLIKENAVPKDIYELQDTGSIHTYAANSMVIGLTAKFVIDQADESPITTRPILPERRWYTYIIKKKGRALTPAAEAFIAHAQDWIRKYHPNEAI